MNRRIAGVCVLVLGASLTVTACGDDDDDSSGGTEPAIEVTDPGAEPRRALSLSAEVGDEAAATMSMAMSFEGTLDGQPLPAQEIPVVDMGLETSVSEVTPERIDSVFRYEDITVGAGGDPAIASTLESSLAGFEGTSGTLSTTASGQLIEADLTLPDDIDPILSSFATQIEDQFRSITIPFPEDPVGIGASWIVQTDLELSGVTSQIDSTYTLEELRGDRYTLAVAIEQTTEPGDLEDGGGEILSGESTGTGRVEGHLGALLPIRSEATTEGTTVVEVPVEDGDPQELEQDVTVDLTLEAPSGSP